MVPYAIHLAPLQGYTDWVYREAHARVFGGVDTYYTPFVRLEKDGFRNKELRDLAPEANAFPKLQPLPFLFRQHILPRALFMQPRPCTPSRLSKERRRPTRE